MSLDILMCRVVPPEDAEQAHEVIEYGTRPSIFSMVQPKGFLCVTEERIGRNCLNEKWLQQYKMLGPGEHDDYNASDVKDGVLTPYGKLRFARTRAEFDERIAPYLDTSSEGSWFNDASLNRNFDFIWVCW